MKSKKEQKLTKYVALAIALQLGSYGIIKYTEHDENITEENLTEDTKNNEKFDLKDLIVWETKDIAGESHIYILEETNTDNIFEEYHHNFKAIAGTMVKENLSNPGEVYVTLDEYEPLYIYLTNEEQEKASNGVITTSELDNISNRLNTEYKENVSAKTLTKKAKN